MLHRTDTDSPRLLSPEDWNCYSGNPQTLTYSHVLSPGACRVSPSSCLPGHRAVIHTTALEAVSFVISLLEW